MEREFLSRNSNRPQNKLRNRRLFLESLETRTLMAVDVQPIPASFFPQPIEKMNYLKFGTELTSVPVMEVAAAKVPSELRAQLDLSNVVIPKGLPAEFRSARVSDLLGQVALEYEQYRSRGSVGKFDPSGKLATVQDNSVLVEAIASVSGAELAKDLEALGGRVKSAADRVLTVWMPLDRIRDLSSLNSLKFAKPPMGMMLTSAGDTTSQGLPALYTSDVIGRFGLDGTGIKIGVISDSFDVSGDGSYAADIASGDLPGPGNPFGNTLAVHVLSDGVLNEDTDEGRAMLQIVHDMAPKAELYFSTPGLSKSDYEDAIEALVAAGCHVIVDDAMFFAEPMFMDGIVARAANAAVASGVAYVTAAGNAGRKSYDFSTFVNAGAFYDFDYGLGSRPLHDFNPTASVDPYQQITIPAGAFVTFTLQWAEPFETDATPSNGAQTDYDFMLLNSSLTTILSSDVDNDGFLDYAISASDNINGTHDPVEVFQYVNQTGSTVTGNLLIAKYAGASSPRLRYVISNNNVTISQYDNTSPTSYGHANAANVLSVGAVAWQNTPGWGVSPPVRQAFSSWGGMPILFDANGNSISIPIRQKPDVLGPDEVNNTFFGSDLPSDADAFPNFRGTSAAAPHVAGLVGLMRQLSPTTSVAALFNNLRNTAVEIAQSGYAAGYDPANGWGLAQGRDALYATYEPAMPDLAAGSDNGISSTDNVTTATSLTFTGTVPTGSYVGLFEGATLVGSQQLGVGVGNYSINITATNNAHHAYYVKVKNSSSQTVWSPQSQFLNVYVDSLAATITTTAPDMTAASDTGSLNVDNFTTDSTPTFTGNVDAAAAGSLVTLFVDGNQVGSQTLAPGATAYSITASTLAFGSHSAVIRTRRVSVSTPSNYPASPALAFFVDNGGAPVATITAITPDPRKTTVSSIQITFDRPVYGFDVADLTLTKNGGANRLPGTSTINTLANYQSMTLQHIEDLTLGSGTYVFTINYAGSGILSAAASVAPSASNPSDTWVQQNTAYQNGAAYYDVNNSGTISAFDALQVINALNTYGALPPASYPNPYYLDVNGDNIVTAFDANAITNYLNQYAAGAYLARVGGGSGESQEPITPDQVTAEVVLQTVDMQGSPITSIVAGQQFQLQASLVVNGPDGVRPMAAYTDIRISNRFVTATANAADIGLIGSTITAGLIDEAGRVIYDFDNPSASLMYSKTFTATQAGTVTFAADAAELEGHEIYVTGFNDPLPISQVRFGSTTLQIKQGKKK